MKVTAMEEVLTVCQVPCAKGHGPADDGGVQLPWSSLHRTHNRRGRGISVVPCPLQAGSPPPISLGEYSEIGLFPLGPFSPPLRVCGRRRF